jgi:RimJ/RimL family protein N-acetyltransferase
MRTDKAFTKAFESTIQTYREDAAFRIEDLIYENKDDPVHPEVLFLVLLNGREIVSTCRLLYDTKHRYGYINLVYTNPMYRGQKICQHSIEFLLRKTKRDVDNYELDVLTANEAAKKCYENNNFTVVKANKKDRTVLMRFRKRKATRAKTLKQQL